MADRRYEEIPDSEGSFFVKFEKPGDAAEGVYMRARQEKDSFGKMQEVYDLKGDDGTEVTVGGTRDIDRKMASIKIGDYVQIELKEILPLAGDRTFKRFAVRRAVDGPAPGGQPKMEPAPAKPSGGKAPF